MYYSAGSCSIQTQEYLRGGDDILAYLERCIFTLFTVTAFYPITSHFLKMNKAFMQYNALSYDKSMRPFLLKK